MNAIQAKPGRYNLEFEFRMGGFDVPLGFSVATRVVAL